MNPNLYNILRIIKERLLSSMKTPLEKIFLLIKALLRKASLHKFKMNSNIIFNKTKPRKKCNSQILD
jgi:hypothetical protein